MNLDDLVSRISALFADLALRPLRHFFLGLSAEDRTVLYVFLAAAAGLGFLLGRRRSGSHWRVSSFQNSGEELVSRELLSHFAPPTII